MMIHACRETPVNPFEEVRRQPEAPCSVIAHSAAAGVSPRSGPPSRDPTQLRAKKPSPQPQAPPATGNPESLRSVRQRLQPSVDRIHRPGVCFSDFIT